MTLGHEQIQATAAYVRDRISGLSPRVGLVLGSGLGAFAEKVEAQVSFSYNALPHFPVSTVEGHKGRLVAGSVDGVPLLCMQGRVHGYEGYDPTEVVFPVRVLLALGARTIILTNAAGGIHADWAPGDLMVISDHINLTGKSPLSGANDPRLGVRFPDMTDLYAPKLQELAHRSAKGLGFALRSGVYLGLNGPQYETPAEIRMAKGLGADAVGMSTVFEAIAARHGGAEILGISCITNLAAGISKQALSHSEVKDTANAVEERFVGLVRRVVAAL
jgi:purine-nucleoside phosphorylase